MANENELHNININNNNNNDDDDDNDVGHERVEAAQRLESSREGGDAIEGVSRAKGVGGGGGVQRNLSHQRFNDDDDESRWLQLEQNDYEIDQIGRIDLNPASTSLLTEYSLNDNGSTGGGGGGGAGTNENIEHNFNRLHQIADKIKHTIREHLNSESSNCSDTAIETDPGNNSTNNNNTNNGNIVADPFVNHYADQTLDEFKEELRLKREARQNAVQQMRDEITNLREQLEYERELNKRLRLCNGNSRNNSSLMAINNNRNNDNNNQRDEMLNVADNQLNINVNLNDYNNNNSNNNDTNDYNENNNVNVNGNDAEMTMQRNRHAIIELANAQLSLQMANSENISLRTELAAVQKQCATLKEVVACCKQMMAIKEEQCNEQTPLTVILGEDLRKKMANALERLQLTEMNNRLKLY